MSVKIKRCADCGKIKRIGRSKSRCKSCRKADPKKFLNRPAYSGPKHKNKTKRFTFGQLECVTFEPAERLTIGPFVNWRVCDLPMCVYPKNKDYSTIDLNRSQRDFVLNTCGYKNYNDDYLRSDLWLKTIRVKALQEDMCACGCGKHANTVHHQWYTEANLLGISLCGLVPLHQDCHYEIEFSENRKCNIGEANSRLKARQYENGGGKYVKIPTNRLLDVKHHFKNEQHCSDQLDFIGDWTVDFSLQPGDVLPGADTA